MDDYKKMLELLRDIKQQLTRIEKKVEGGTTTRKAQNLKIVTMVETSEKIPQQTMKKIIKNLDSLKAPQLVLIILNYAKKLTRNQQVDFFKKIGKKSTTFQGGNYKRDILSKGLVTEIGKIGKEPIYGLTEKGKIEADKVLEELGD